MAAGMIKAMFIILIASTAALMAAICPRANAAISGCGQVITGVSPCLPYLSTSASTPPPACCSALRTLNAAADSPAARRTACTCLKALSQQLPPSAVAKAAGVPGKCGVSLPYQLTPSIDCSHVCNRMAVSTARVIKAACIAITACMVAALAVAPRADAAIECSQVFSSLRPCLSYVLGGFSLNPECCPGIREIYAAAKTTPDRQSVCSCLTSAAKSFPRLYLDRAGGLPRKCGVNISYRFSSSTDCSKLE